MLADVRACTCTSLSLGVGIFNFIRLLLVIMESYLLYEMPIYIVFLVDLIISESYMGDPLYYIRVPHISDSYSLFFRVVHRGAIRVLQGSLFT